MAQNPIWQFSTIQVQYNRSVQAEQEMFEGRLIIGADATQKP